jgi:acyl carrier protein
MESILKLLQEIRPEADFASSEDFIHDSLLDSFDIMELIGRLEACYNIQIKVVDIIPENFMNITAISELIKKYGCMI